MSYPGLNFYTIDYDDTNFNEIQLYVREVGTSEWIEFSEPVVIHDICPDWDFIKQINISLKPYANKIIQLRFQVAFKSVNLVSFNQIIVGDNVIPAPVTFDLNRINRYLEVSNISHDEAVVYWTDGEDMPDKVWGKDGDFYTGSYHDITSTF